MKNRDKQSLVMLLKIFSHIDSSMRSRFIVSLFIVTAMGLSSKAYRGWGDRWVNYSAGGIFYIIFWCLLFFTIFPARRNCWRIPAIVFLATSFVEILQLWRLPVLEAMRSRLLGRLLLGTTFDWGDFVDYAIGAVLAWGWLVYINQQEI